jgi:hypothetical protein
MPVEATLLHNIRFHSISGQSNGIKLWNGSQKGSWLKQAHGMPNISIRSLEQGKPVEEW